MYICSKYQLIMMKWFFGIFLFSILGCIELSAQQLPVNIRFTHFFGEEELPINRFFATESGTELRIDRFSWYGSYPQVIMNDGSSVNCGQEFFIFRMDQGKQGLASLVSDPSQISAFRFFFGVDSLYNHRDPSTYPPSHPLAHQNPSMHWGWIAGYIFNAFEGKSRKAGQAEESFFIHSIGNTLYSQVDIPVFPILDPDGNWLIEIHVDLERLVGALDMHGLIAMGDFEENVFLVNRLQAAGVFVDPNEGVSSISNKDINSDRSILFPNPVKSGANLYFKEGQVRQLVIFDTQGRLVWYLNQALVSNDTKLPELQSGIYYVRYETADGRSGVEKLIVSE
jgi:hypothetical protein